jgi:hypothetical protein
VDYVFDDCRERATTSARTQMLQHSEQLYQRGRGVSTDSLLELDRRGIVQNAHSLSVREFYFSFRVRCGGFDLAVNLPTSSSQKQKWSTLRR